MVAEYLPELWVIFIDRRLQKRVVVLMVNYLSCTFAPKRPRYVDIHKG